MSASSVCRMNTQTNIWDKFATSLSRRQTLEHETKVEVQNRNTITLLKASEQEAVGEEEGFKITEVGSTERS